jgi:YVTN family beta-propeller protein
MKWISVFACAISVLGCCVSAQAANYQVKTRYPIPGNDGWDYITIDSASRRLYVSHAVRVNVLNADTGALVGTIEDTPGIHGIAIAHNLRYGFTSNGKEDTVTMFDIGTLSVIKKIDVGKGPDGIYFDAGSQRVFTNNHHSHDITAIDAKNNRIFVGGHNKTMSVLDAATGRKIMSLPTGSGTDAAGFDAKDHLIFFSNGEGNLTIIKQLSADDYVSEASIATQPSAKTMAFDEITQMVFLPAVNVVSVPVADPSKKPKKTITNGTFCVLVVRKQ